MRARAPAITWLAGFTLLAGALNLVVLLAQTHALIHALDLDADYASAFVEPALASQALHGSIINLGNHAYYEFWWFERATYGLPGWRTLWELAPLAIWALGAGLVAWCAWVAAGRLGAIVSAVLLVSISDPWRHFLGMPAARVETAFHAAALCATLLIVSRARRAPQLSRAWLGVLTVVTVALAAAAATDPLVAVTLLPAYVLAPVVWWIYDGGRDARNVAVYATVTGALALVGGILLASLMQGEHVVHSAVPIVFVPATGLLTEIQTLVGDWATVAGGGFFGGSASGSNLLGLAVGTLALGGLAVVVALALRGARTAARGRGGDPSGDPARPVYVAYWGLVMGLGLGVLGLTQVLTWAGTAGVHYLVSAWVAAAALLACVPRSRRAWMAVLVGVAAYSVLTLRSHVVDGVPVLAGYPGPSQALATEIDHFARANGAKFGYAEYWDASVITWENRLAEPVYPVDPCANGRLCPDSLSISSWYTPERGVRTFLVTDPNTGTPGGFNARPASLGPPIAETMFDDYFVYVYGYDVAAQFGPSPA